MKYPVVTAALMLVAPWIATAADKQPAPAALPPIETAASDEQGRITVNGRPFFPILMYDVPLDADSLAMFRRHGFNVLSARAEDAEVARQAGFYIAAHAANTDKLNMDGVLFGVGMDSPALYWKDDLLEKSKNDLAAVQKLFPRRPVFHAIGYWEDEPEGVFTNKLPSKARYEDLVKVLDVSAPYLYPLPYQPVRSVGEAVERASAASGGRKPLLPVLQLFAWKPEDRYPTPAELKCMAYLALLHGADGIGYYSYNYVAGKDKTNIAREQPELWRSVQPLNAEVKRIGEYLLDSVPDTTIKVTAAQPAVEWRAMAQENTTLLLLANTSAEPQKVCLHFAARLSALCRIGDGARLPIKEGAQEFTLGPFDALALLGEK